MSDQVFVKRLQVEAEAQQAFPCMVEVPAPWPEALSICRTWVGQNLGRYVEGYHLQDADGSVFGQLYYAPSERALVPYEIEPGAAVLYCEWVQRRHQKQGFGRLLFSAFEADMRAQERKGILVECTDQEAQMYYGHYLVRGFNIIHGARGRKLLYLPLIQSGIKFQPLVPTIQPRHGIPVEVLILGGYLCPFETATQVLLLDVASEFGDRVIVRQEPLSPETLHRYGVAYGIFINGHAKLTGAATEEAIRQAIIEEMPAIPRAAS
jgi:GNAT superfamily N-acetyltransferase